MDSGGSDDKLEEELQVVWNLFEMPWRLSAHGCRAAAAIVVDYLTKRLPGSDVGPTSATGIVALIFRFKDFEIDVARQELRRTGTIVHIEPQVFDLLVYLIQNRDRIVSKDELIDAVWQGRIVSDATLSSRISSARRALGDSGNDQNLIRTLHRRGFRFVGEVDSSTAAGMAIEDGPPPESASHDAAKLVRADEPPPLADDPSIDPGADPAPVEHGAVATKRHSAQNLVFAVAAIGFASLLVT